MQFGEVFSAADEQDPISADWLSAGSIWDIEEYL